MKSKEMTNASLENTTNSAKKKREQWMNHAIFCFKVVKLCARTEPSESKVRLEGSLK